MPGKLRWRTLGGSELIDAKDERRLSEIMPNAPAVYIWRRKLTAPIQCQGSGRAFRDWLRDISLQPTAQLTGRSLSHCVWVDGIKLGGGGLPDEKQRTVEQLSESHKARDNLVSFIESLSIFMPVIYVGQTNDLRKRVREHIDGESKLRSYVHDTLGLAWADFELHFLETGAATDVSERGESVRELLELLAQRLLAPFGVERPG